jgi:glucose/arabinose dehydrogenase
VSIKRLATRLKLLPTTTLLASSMILAACAPTAAQSARAAPTTPTTPNTPTTTVGVMKVPEGFQVEKVVDGLTYPTSITWDDEGNMYVAEAGGAFLEEPPPARILRVENGQATEVADLGEKGIKASVVGLLWHDGAFYFTHRTEDLTGAVSRMTMDGQVEQLFSGIVDSQTDHQVNDIQLGPDGMMYVASGVGGNSGFMGQDMTPFVLKNPDTHATSC